MVLQYYTGAKALATKECFDSKTESGYVTIQTRISF